MNIEEDKRTTQKTLDIDENLNKKLQLHKVLNNESNSQAMNNALEDYLNQFDNLKLIWRKCL